MSITLVAVIAGVWAFIGVFGLILCKAAAKPMPAPPARPRSRKVDINLDDIEWDWRRVG